MAECMFKSQAGLICDKYECADSHSAVCCFSCRFLHNCQEQCQYAKQKLAEQAAKDAAAKKARAEAREAQRCKKT